MRTYLVERFVPASRLATLAEALAHADFASHRVAHLGSLTLPGDESCLCAFGATTPRAVATANETFGLEFERIVEAFLISGSWCAALPKTPSFRRPSMRGDD